MKLNKKRVSFWITGLPGSEKLQLLKKSKNQLN